MATGMKIVDCVQGEQDWIKARLGKVTASEMDNIISPEWKIRDGEMPRTYLCRKLAEAWRGEPLPGFSSWSTERGEMLEMDAFNWYRLQSDEKIQRVGFCLADDGRCGCSPDALLGEDNGLEVKCAETPNHLKWLLDGKIPKEHRAQVHMSLYVTGRPRWTFLAYHNRFPKLLITVERDEKIMKQIHGALSGFYLAFDQAWARLKELSA